MNYKEREHRLNTIKETLTKGEKAEEVTVREFIWWWLAERRGYRVTWRIRRELEQVGLVTVPDFDGAHIDSRIRFQLPAPPPIVEPAPVEVNVGEGDVPMEPPQAEAEQVVVPEFIVGASAEPAYRVSRLLAASKPPLSISPDCSLQEAVTLMLRHDYSQLPVMTNERDVKGIVSWESIGPRLALRDEKVEVARDCMRQSHEVNSTDSLFSVINSIVEHSYVLVRGEDKKITGIVTTTDLSLQFQQLSEPFLLLSEIENHIRLLIDGRFTADDLNGVKDPADPDRVIESVADLTFGEYIRLLETPNLWEKTQLKVDRKVFVKELDRIRLIRNDVMHFDPDGISSADHTALRRFVQFLHDIRAIQK